MHDKATGPRITFEDVGAFLCEPAPVEHVEVSSVFRGTIEVLDREPLRFSVSTAALPPCEVRVLGFDGERWLDITDGKPV